MSAFNKFILCVSTAACCCLSGTSVAAQQVMTLHACMQYAVDHSVKVKLQEMEVDDARINRRQAIFEAFTPSISGQTYAYSNFGRSLDPETNTYVSTTSFNNGYGVSGGIYLFNGFSAVNNLKISNTALKMGLDQAQLAQDEICLATMEAYYNVVYYQELEKILEGQVQTAEAALKRARKQEELGQKGYAEVIEMEAELADCQLQLITASNHHQDALLTLKDLMFWPMDQDLVIDTSMTAHQVLTRTTDEQALSETLQYATHHLPSITLAQHQIEQARINLQSAKWRFAPSLSLNGGWSTSYYTYPGLEGYVPASFRTQFRNNGGEYIQLSLSIPIFDRFSKVSQVRRSKNAYRKATLNYEQQIREVEAEVTRAHQDRDGASAAYLQAERRAALQEEAYSLNLKKYEQGLISSIDFQKASDNWLNAKSNRLNALLQYYIKRSIVAYYNGIPYLEQVQ